MSIQSYSSIPISNLPMVDKNGIVDNIWQLFFAKLATGIRPYVRYVPVSGFNFTVPNGTINVVFDPAGIIATGTIVMPASPTDGQELTCSTSQTITAATFSPSAGQTIVNAPTNLTSAGAAFIFVQPVATWYRTR